MKAQIGITEEAATSIARLLNQVLADENLLYIKTRNYHWNVKGVHFHDLHLFFEGQYNILAEQIDDVAERIRQLNQHAIGTMVEFLEHTQLQEEPGKDLKSKDMLSNLLSDHETVIGTLREIIGRVGEELGDAGTADKLTAWMQEHEKMAWMLRSYLQ
jgi:starvation-inducible DNA-binding protein